MAGSPAGSFRWEVYVSSLIGEIDAFDAASGTPLWRYTFEDGQAPFISAAAGVVFAGIFDGELSGLDAESGELLWRYDIGGFGLVPPIVADGVVYAASLEDKVLAFKLPQ